MANNKGDLPAYVEQHATRNDPESILRAIDKYAVTKVPGGWMMNVGPIKGAILDEQVIKALSNPPADPERGHVLVEMGYYIGYSTVMIARKIKALNKKATLYSFDPSSHGFRIATEILKFAGLSEHVKLVVDTVDNALPKLLAEQGIKKIDFAFIDHEKTVYLSDFQLLERHNLFNPNTIVLADNLLFPGAGDYYYYVYTHKKFRSRVVLTKLEYHDIEDVMLISEYQG